MNEINKLNERRKPKITDYASVESICGGVPVYSFKHLIYVYGNSPDLSPHRPAQENNSKSVSKIKLKKTWDIKNNFICICHEMTPRTSWTDSQPHLPVHLIDGDPNTIWSSFECFAQDGRPEWIRIDLPVESMISAVNITCLKNYMGKEKGTFYRPWWNWGHSLPKELEVKLSRDAWHWDTVFESRNILESGCIMGDPDDPDGITIVLNEPVLAKMILITGNHFNKIGYDAYMFSINGVEVKGPVGDNLALISKGAGVTVSSTSDHHNSDLYSANSLWGPLQYELGNKWVKIGSDNGSGLWCFTEHEKGKLEIDEELDKALYEAVANGIKIVFTLDFKGNWIYERPPRKTNWFESRFREINESYMCGIPRVDDNPEMFQGYLRYVDYMVRHLKGHAAYFEIGNEWNAWDGKRTIDWYMNTIFEPTYDAIKKADPDAKISLGALTHMAPEDLLYCLGTGVTAHGGKLSVPGRMLLTAKGVNTKDVVVSLDVESASPAGIVLGFESPHHFLAAIYEPANKSIYFLECIGDHWLEKDVIAKYSPKSVAAAEGLAPKVYMEATYKNGAVTFTVSDGKKAMSTAYQAENISEGSVGILHCPGEPAGVFSHFRVAGGSDGAPIFEDDFDTSEISAAKWELFWHRWDYGKKPVAAKRVDAISWHSAELPHKAYFDKVKKFKKECEKLGFKGAYFCNELYAGSAYPPGPEDGNIFRTTDFGEAKFLACHIAGHSSLNIAAGNCHVHFTGFPHPQSLSRTTCPSQVLAPSQPKPSFYCFRNLATAMDNFYEAEFPVEFSDSADIIHFTLDNEDKTQLMIAAWVQALPADSIAERKTDIILPGIECGKAWAVDVFNGTEQELDVVYAGTNTVLKGMLIKDYPLLVKLQPE